MTNNEQQTAVEWLIEQLHYKYGGTDFFWTNMDEIEQAKEMEKWQIMQSLNDGKSMALNSIENQSLEKYYNKTYGEGEQ